MSSNFVDSTVTDQAPPYEFGRESVIHRDIKKAIELIDQRIESLNKIRESLAREFGMEDAITPAVRDTKSEPKQFLLAGTAPKMRRLRGLLPDG